MFLAMAGTIYQNIAIGKITPILPGAPASDIAEVIAGTSNPVFQALPSVVRAKVVVEIISAMSTVWALLIAGMALSFILSFFLGVSPQLSTWEHPLTCTCRGRGYTWKVEHRLLRNLAERHRNDRSDRAIAILTSSSKLYVIVEGIVGFRMVQELEWNLKQIF